MHPTHEVRIALHHQMIAIIAQPGRYAHPDSRPFIACPLGKALHLNDTVIQPDHSFTEARFTESGAGGNFVHFPAIYPQACLYCIQIAISPAPEMQVIHFGCRFQRLFHPVSLPPLFLRMFGSMYHHGLSVLLDRKPAYHGYIRF